MLVANGVIKKPDPPRITILKSPVKLDSTKEARLNSKAYLDHNRAPMSRCSLKLHHIKVTNTR